MPATKRASRSSIITRRQRAILIATCRDEQHKMKPKSAIISPRADSMTLLLR